jgi:hypothetical protein
MGTLLIGSWRATPHAPAPIRAPSAVSLPYKASVLPLS